MFKNIVVVIKRVFEPAKLNQVILFITSKCNLRCQHCFNWRNLDGKDELSLEEIKKISNNLPQFDFLLLTGGEPFVRRDIVELVKTFRENNNVTTVSIPTNGFLVSKTVEKLKELLSIDPKLGVFINFSIDGVGKVHDKMRGREGSFKNVISSLTKATKLRDTYPNLKVNVNTTITSKNITNVEKLIDFILSQEKIHIDGHYFEIVRGEPRKTGMKSLNEETLTRLYDKKILPYQEKLLRRRRGNKLLNVLFASFAKTNFNYIYRAQYRNFISKKAWSMPCLAGQSAIVINHKGMLQFCELRDPIADLRKEKFNPLKVISGKKGRKELKSIKKDRCFCTHVCFLTDSMYKSPKVVFLEMPLLWLKNLFNCTVK